MVLNRNQCQYITGVIHCAILFFLYFFTMAIQPSNFLNAQAYRHRALILKISPSCF